MFDVDDADRRLREAAEARDPEVLIAIGWELIGAYGGVAASLNTLRAACREVPESAWPAHRLPLRAA